MSPLRPPFAPQTKTKSCAMETVHRHIFQPIPDLTVTSVPDSKEDRVKTIIANLEKQHHSVIASILASAQDELEKLRQRSTTISNGAHQANGSDHVDAVQSQTHDQLLANLTTPAADPEHDLCILRGFIPTSPPGVSQAPVPREVEVAKRTIEQIEAYDRHAKQTIDYYRRALRNFRESRASAGETERAGAAGAVERRKDPRLAGRRAG